MERIISGVMEPPFHRGGRRELSRRSEPSNDPNGSLQVPIARSASLTFPSLGDRSTITLWPGMSAPLIRRRAQDVGRTAKVPASRGRTRVAGAVAAARDD